MQTERIVSPTAGSDAGPHIPSSVSLREVTIKAVVLGVILSVILGAANAYLGLFAGMTVSASIPAAVISMGILKLFKQSNILENNIVQTAASAGESLAAGVIFTIPALVIMGVWTEFDYFETTMIAGLGGILGVLFTIPLRRALIVERPLQFPEGIATAEVLKVGESGGGGIKFIAWAGLIGALFKLSETGLRVWTATVEYARFAGTSIFYLGSNLSPALVAVGYIVGLNIAVLMFIGGVINWWVAIPIIAAGYPATGGTPYDVAWEIWSTQTRYLGVGAMIVGGLWALVKLRTSVIGGIRSGMKAYRTARNDNAAVIERTEREMPMQWIGLLLMLATIPLYLIFEFFTGSIWISAVMAVAMLVGGFLFSAVAGYMAGLVGSSNNPISGVAIATILTAALLLLLLMGAGNPKGAASAIFIGAVVGCAAAIAGDNMQDLKAGYLLGATPIKQQTMQMIGVIAAALVMAPILSLLLNAYGIGEPTAAHSDPLAAPQATLMASVATGVFMGGLPWSMVIIGMLVAVAVIVVDVILEKRGSTFRAPVLAIAVGIYLPFELEVPIFIGGVLAWAAGRTVRRGIAQADGSLKPRLNGVRATGQRQGLLFAAGLITGEALLGILLAIPIVVAGRADVIALGVGPWNGLGIVLMLVVMYALYRVTIEPMRRARR